MNIEAMFIHIPAYRYSLRRPRNDTEDVSDKH